MQKYYDGLAEILEIDVAEITESLKLTDYAWDSLAIVSMIALIDELYDTMLDGQSLANCATVADITALLRTREVEVNV
jgi:acyl carrier protein